jgi:hypothetical protein
MTSINAIRNDVRKQDWKTMLENEAGKQHQKMASDNGLDNSIGKWHRETVFENSVRKLHWKQHW